MTNLLIRTFIKNGESRESYGKLAGWVGIVTNLLLFAIKFMIGVVTSSISIMTDAINNLSDSSSSLITIVGFKLSSIPADEEHPYGHARFEYISGLLVACIVFVIGAQFLINSFKKTIHPENTTFSMLAAALLLFSILVKFWQSGFYNKLGKRINSKVLLATAIDSRNDVISTAAVLISSLVEHFTGWHLDGPMGMIVSLFVIYSGIELLKDTLAPLIGQAPKKKVLDDIRIKILEYPSVIDVHDLILHNYGPEQLFGSVHVEVPASQDIMKSHEIIDGIERDFLRDQGIQMVIHIDPVDTNDPEWDSLELAVKNIALAVDPVLSVHGFRLVRGRGYTRILFDVTVPPGYKIKDTILRKDFVDRIKALDETYEPVVTLDRSYTSTIN